MARLDFVFNPLYPASPLDLGDCFGLWEKRFLLCHFLANLSLCLPEQGVYIAGMISLFDPTYALIVLFMVLEHIARLFAVFKEGTVG